MVAEAIPEVQTPAPEAEVENPPELETGTTPTPEPEVVDDIATDVLKELGLDGVATDDGTGKATPADEPADPYAGLSPQEIAKKVRDEVAAENDQKTSSRDYQNYVAGVQRSFSDTFDALDRLGDEKFWDADTKKAVKDRFATFNGHWDVLFKHAVTQDRQTQKEGMAKALSDAAASLGLKDVTFESASDFVSKLTEHGKAGSVSESKAKERERDAATNAVKAYRKRLIDAGVDIPGVRVAEVPNNPGNGGSGKGYTDMTPEERAALTPQQRDETIARQYRRK